MMPFGAMRLRKSVTSVSVTFVAGSSTVYAVATSANVSIPAGAIVGNRLLAWVFARSAITPPAGWTLVDSITEAFSGNNQRISVYERVCQIGDAGASTTWNVAVSGRLGLHINAFDKVGATPSVISTTKTTVSGDNTQTTAVSGITASANGQMAVGGVTWVSISDNNITAPPGMTLSSQSGVTDNRMGVAYQARDNGQSISGNFAHTTSASSQTAKVSVLLG